MRSVLVFVAIWLSVGSVCIAGEIGTRYGTEIEEKCLADIEEDVEVSFVSEKPCLGDTALSASFIAVSLADKAVSYEVVLIKEEAEWRIWGISRSLQLDQSNGESFNIMLGDRAISVEDARAAVGAVVGQLKSGESIIGVLLPDNREKWPNSLMVNTRDMKRKTLGGRVFRATETDQGWTSEENGWWVI
jgi:hypothetical protein